MEEVKVHLYDLSRGMASSFSAGLLGMQIEGIWHTGVVVFNLEYFYGGGIQAAHPNTVSSRYNMSPNRVVTIGRTNKTQRDLIDFLERDVIKYKYTAEAYDLFNNNCNNFSQDVVQFLTDGAQSIPYYVLSLPEQVLSTPIGRTVIAPMYRNFQQNVMNQGGFIPFNDPSNIQSPQNQPNFDQAMRNLFQKLKKGKLGDEKPVALTKNSLKSNQIFTCTFNCVDKHMNLIEAEKFTSILIVNVKNGKKKIDPEIFNSEEKSLAYEVFREPGSVKSELNFVEEAIGILFSLSDEQTSKILIISRSGNNESIVVAASYLHQVLDSDSVMNTLISLQEKNKIYMSYALCEALGNQTEDEKFLEALKYLHQDSKPPKISRTSYEGEIKQIMDLGLPDVTKATAKQVLEQTNGNVEQAINILL
eukprot:snap_masked-scaffold_1-processed-gene-9.35-mRNA-1 protein AED:0.29 eAED:0.29 QI:0/-1/0/1/-1/1/1/0/417